MYLLKLGNKSISPNKNIITIDKVRKRFADKPVILTILESAKVKKVKLKIKPATIPNGLFLPPIKPPERIIGRTGRMHGDKIVTIPEINAKTLKKIIMRRKEFILFLVYQKILYYRRTSMCK